MYGFNLKPKALNAYLALARQKANMVVSAPRTLWNVLAAALDPAP